MRKIYLFFAAVVFCSITAYAQDEEMTPYELKREQLEIQAIEKIMNTLSAYDNVLFSVHLLNALKESHEEGDRYQEMIVGENIIFAICNLGEGLQTEANLLSKSFSMSDVYAGEALQEWKEIGQWYKQERLKLDQTKTSKDIQRELHRAELMRNQPGILGVKQRVRKSFLKWAKKGQFEKTVAYNERMSKSGTAVFDSLCFVQFNEMINTEMNRSLDRDYDADREGYGMKFYYGEKGNEAAYVDAFWPITPQQVRIARNVDWERTYSKGLFEKDGYYFPATYHFEMHGSDYSGNQKWDIVLGEPESVVLTIREVIGVDAIYDLDHVFDYSAYSTNLVSQDELAWKVWEFFNGQDNPYLVKKTIPVGNLPYMRTRQYERISPEGKQFFTREEVELTLQRIEAEQAAKNLIEDLPCIPQWIRGKADLRDEQIRQEILHFLYDLNDKQRGEYLALKMSEDESVSGALTEYTVKYSMLHSRPVAVEDILKLIKRIDNYSSKYSIDMVPVYLYVIETTPYYSKMYRRGTPEEKAARFRAIEMR